MRGKASSPLQGPERGRANYPRASEELDQLSTVLRFQHAQFLWLPVVTWLQTSTQTSAIAGPWTQTWPEAAAQPRCHHGPRRQHRPPRSHQHGPRWLTRFHASAQHLVVTGATSINTDHGCGWATHLDMVLSCSPGQDITMPFYDSVGRFSLRT